MQLAWHQDAKTRPTFEEIVEQVQQLLESQMSREQAAKKRANAGLPPLPPARSFEKKSASFGGETVAPFRDENLRVLWRLATSSL